VANQLASGLLSTLIGLLPALPGALMSLRGPVNHLLVVVPVRNEQQRIAACLEAIHHAVRRTHAHSLGDGASGAWLAPAVQLIVVLDSCTDRTADIVARYPEVRTVRTDAGCVGAARALGVSAGLERSHESHDRVWVATTDGDSRVPPSWLTHQLDLAHAGSDLVRGLVEPDIDECGPATYARWHADYDHSDKHPHIHGANLGVRASAYLRCAGFDRTATAHEDVRLVRAAEAHGLTVTASTSVVTTSGRTRGRVGSESFADYLRACGPEVTAPSGLSLVPSVS
jgi:glycosyltransferase involved in cell wall biosynthesis